MTSFYTPNQAGKMLGVTGHTVRSWIIKGRVAHIRTPGGYYRIPRSEIERILTPIPAQGRVVDGDSSVGGALPPALF